MPTPKKSPLPLVNRISISQSLLKLASKVIESIILGLNENCQTYELRLALDSGTKDKNENDGNKTGGASLYFIIIF